MKKLFFTAVSILCFSAVSIAQEKEASALVPPQLSKEQKTEMKAREESNLAEAFKAAGLSEEQMTKAREIFAQSSKKMKEIKNNEKLPEEEKGTEKKKINEEKTAQLKAVMGDEKYKIYNETRKKQKAENEQKKAGE